MSDRTKLYMVSGIAVAVAMIAVKLVATVINSTVATLLGV